MESSFIIVLRIKSDKNTYMYMFTQSVESYALIGQYFSIMHGNSTVLLYLKPFPTYNKSAADDFENIKSKIMNQMNV